VKELILAIHGTPGSILKTGGARPSRGIARQNIVFSFASSFSDKEIIAIQQNLSMQLIGCVDDL